MLWDNSKQGQKTKRYKKAYAIGFFKNNKRQTADVGDVIKVAVRGETCRALIVGTRKPKGDNMVPRYDNNNIVLVDENLAPLGTRIRGPIPNILRKQRDKYSKVFSYCFKICITFRTAHCENCSIFKLSLFDNPKVCLLPKIFFLFLNVWHT